MHLKAIGLVMKIDLIEKTYNCNFIKNIHSNNQFEICFSYLNKTLWSRHLALTISCF